MPDVLVIEAIKAAPGTLGSCWGDPPGGVRGAPYDSQKAARSKRRPGVCRSPGRVATSDDHAVAEVFVVSSQCEQVRNQRFDGLGEAMPAIDGCFQRATV